MTGRSDQAAVEVLFGGCGGENKRLGPGGTGSSASRVFQLFFLGFGGVSPLQTLFTTTAGLTFFPYPPLHHTTPTSADRPSTIQLTTPRAIAFSTSDGSMVRSCLRRCIRSLKPSRAFHVSSAFRDAPPSIAQLLDLGPVNSGNVIVNGFIRSIRNQKQRSFASIGDGSTLEPLQALLTPEQAQRLELPVQRLHARVHR
jgi:hypothetical protein